MLRRLSTVLLATLVFGGVAEAKKAKVRPADDEDAAPSGPLSEQERIGKEYVVTFEPVGLATPLGLGQALNFGKYLDGNRLLELSIAYANVTTSDSTSLAGSTDDSFGDNARIEGHSSVVAVRYKEFVTNSFYWYAGGADRMTQASMYIVPEDSGGRTKIASVDAHDLGITGAIGNAWQWEAFTIGCDWIGLYQPLIPFKHDYNDQGASLTNESSDISKGRDTFKSYTQSTNITGLRFYVGASF